MSTTNNQSTSVREINDAINLQSMRGTRTVKSPDGHRLFRARRHYGQLQVRYVSSSDDTWHDVTHATIDYV